jgi:hypothetical protein
MFYYNTHLRVIIPETSILLLYQNIAIAATVMYGAECIKGFTDLEYWRYGHKKKEIVKIKYT